MEECTSSSTQPFPILASSSTTSNSKVPIFGLISFLFTSPAHSQENKMSTETRSSKSPSHCLQPQRERHLHGNQHLELYFINKFTVKLHLPYEGTYLSSKFHKLQLALNSLHVDKMQAFPIGFSWEWPVWTVEQWLRECSHVAWFLVLLKSWKTCLLALSLESWWLLPKCAEQNFPQEVSTDLRTQQNKQIKQQKNHHHNNTTNHWDTKKCFTPLNNEFRTSGKGEMSFTARNFACANNKRYGG